jgi:hypothetical protein
MPSKEGAYTIEFPTVMNNFNEDKWSKDQAQAILAILQRTKTYMSESQQKAAAAQNFQEGMEWLEVCAGGDLVEPPKTFTVSSLVKFMAREGHNWCKRESSYRTKVKVNFSHPFCLFEHTNAWERPWIFHFKNI